MDVTWEWDEMWKIRCFHSGALLMGFGKGYKSNVINIMFLIFFINFSWRYIIHTFCVVLFVIESTRE